MSAIGTAQQIPRGRDPQYREVYSNASMTQLGPFDISLIFQKVTEVMPGQTAVVDQVCVIFSPQQFKALFRSLAETMEAYESSFGKLSISDSDTMPHRSAMDITAQIDEARKAGQARVDEAAKQEKTPRKPSR